MHNFLNMMEITIKPTNRLQMNLIWLVLTLVTQNFILAPRHMPPNLCSSGHFQQRLLEKWHLFIHCEKLFNYRNVKNGRLLNHNKMHAFWRFRWNRSTGSGIMSLKPVQLNIRDFLLSFLIGLTYWRKLFAGCFSHLCFDSRSFKIV